MTTDRMDQEGAVTEATGEYSISLDISAAKPVIIFHNTQIRKYRACMSLLGVTVVEKMVYYAIFGNLVMYLSQVLHLDAASSVKTVNTLFCVSTVAALVGAYISDAHLGRYRTILTFFTVYSLGLISVTVVSSQPSLRPIPCSLGSEDCRRATKRQLGFFLFSVYLIVIGTSANPCYLAFGGDQFNDQGDAEERKQKASYFNWLFFAICFGAFLALTLIVFIEENVSWELAFAILATCMLMALIAVVGNSSNYRERPPNGSPFTRLAQVLVAAARNWKAKLPSDHQDLYEAPEIMNEKATKSKLLHTSDFGFLDKAAVCHKTSENTSRRSAWRLCTVTDVEEVKLLVRVMPIWITCLAFGICFAQSSTFFVKQGSKMDRRLGSLRIPSASQQSFAMLLSVLFMPIYDRILVPFARRFTGNMRGITILQRIGTGLVLGTLAMVAAALTEKKRLRIVRDLNLLDNPGATTPITFFWVLPQNAIMGVAFDFILAGLQEFFYDQLPDSMRSVGIALYLSVLGVGTFLSNIIIILVVSVTGRGSDHQNSWIVDNLNRARLDKYYWTLAIVSATNFCIYVAIANWYTYKQLPRHPSTQEAILSSTTNVNVAGSTLKEEP